MVTVALLPLVCPTTVEAEVVDQIVATVDREAILLSEVMADLAPEINELQANAASQDEFDRVVNRRLRETLDQAVDSRILYREALMAGLEVDDEIVERRLTELKQLYPSNEEFMKELEEAGETMSDLRARLGKQMLARAMAANKTAQFEKEAVVSESEVAQYYEDHRDDFMRPERARCRQIFMPVEEGGPSPAIVNARLEEVQKELAAGASFADLAEAFSAGAGAKEGGLIGWVTRGDLVEPLENAAFSLEEAGTTDIIQSQYGFHILKVEQKEEAGLASLEEVRKEIEPILRSQAAAERFKKWVAELRKRSRVRVFI
jgi:parvulin-like peptidyl-prolyl isomerase